MKILKILSEVTGPSERPLNMLGLPEILSATRKLSQIYQSVGVAVLF